MDIKELKHKLEGEKGLLENELSKLGIKDPKTGDWGAVMPEMDNDTNSDMNDMGDRDEDFGEASGTLGELELRLKEVDAALAKIAADDGSFGKCEVSGEMIEEDRLNANPAAATCKAHMNQ